jgi:hypothetical protein
MVFSLSTQVFSGSGPAQVPLLSQAGASIDAKLAGTKALQYFEDFFKELGRSPLSVEVMNVLTSKSSKFTQTVTFIKNSHDHPLNTSLDAGKVACIVELVEPNSGEVIAIALGAQYEFLGLAD